MPHTSWKDAAAVLRRRGASAGDDQRELARKVGFKVPQRAPALVAAALIQEHLAEPLRLGGADSVTDGQAEYLQDLVEAVGGRRPAPRSRAVASAWIAVLESRRALKALREVKPQPGDVISHQLRPDEIGKVVSISDDGRINIAGPGGRGIPAHRARVHARAGQGGVRAEDFRRKAKNRRALRARAAGPPSPGTTTVLEPHRVDSFAGSAEVALLRNAIDSARDEKPVQKCLERYPGLLARIAGLTSYGTFLRWQVRFGSQLVPDFLLAVADSSGVNWTLIELESPKAKVGIQKGRFAGKAREGIQQIEDWREWLMANLDYARRSPEEDGLGLPGIRPESPGIVVIGRREAAASASVNVRQRLLEQRNIALHSYDWLLDAVDPAEGFRRPGGPLDWPDWSERM
jgi:hypothetical protein